MESGTIAFVYAKEGKIRVLDLIDAEKAQESLLKDGWKHTLTMNACAYIESLYNNINEVDFVERSKEIIGIYENAR